MLEHPALRRAFAGFVILAAAACDPSTGPAGNPSGNLDVEFRNFISVSATMGETGGSTIVVVGNGTTGNPTIYKVVNPGLGNTVSFTAEWSSQTQSVDCTVTDITGISVPPGVVIQAFGPIGFLDCSGW